MKYDPQTHHRRSIRLKGYDYSQLGGYYITLVAQNREHFFGGIFEGKVVLNDAGKMIQLSWQNLPNRFSNIELDERVIMPNHLHGIINIVKQESVSIADVVGAFKSITTHEYILGVKNSGWPPFEKRLWQRNYWEHIIRNEKELDRIREYIINNPIKWQADAENPDRP